MSATPPLGSNAELLSWHAWRPPTVVQARPRAWNAGFQASSQELSCERYLACLFFHELSQITGMQSLHLQIYISPVTFGEHAKTPRYTPPFSSGQADRTFGAMVVFLAAFMCTDTSSTTSALLCRRSPSGMAWSTHAMWLGPTCNIEISLYIIYILLIHDARYKRCETNYIYMHVQCNGKFI